MRVHIVMKHPTYIYNPKLNIAAGEIVSAHAARGDADSVADALNVKARKPGPIYSVQTKVVKEGKSHGN